ncbi:MAG: hypothetical protein CL917_02565 [Deltaproteobacteria bacterium]|nr:hypothetical protein [Deltaproteobacteria bacterium]
MTTVLAAGCELEVQGDGKRNDQTQLWMRAEELHTLTGWDLKPEGLCKDEACVPLAPESLKEMVDGEFIDASSLWQSLDRPILHDAARKTWMLGEGASDRSRQLESLQAPDFSLPDIDGRMHSLSDHQGKKVLLATWASW